MQASNRQPQTTQPTGKSSGARHSNITRLMLGTSNAYLIKGSDGYVMVDAGMTRRAGRFAKYLRARGIHPRSIKLLVLTHAHYDHANGARAIRKMCRCPIAVHVDDSTLLRRGTVVVSPGVHLTGRFLAALLRTLAVPLKMPSVEPDIVIEKETSLERFGIDGSIVPTPGHTYGSLSVALSSGDVFVGDLAINHLPLRIDEAMPPFAMSVDDVLDSWQKLLDAGAVTIYPGHGSPFPAQKLRQRLAKARR